MLDRVKFFRRRQFILGPEFIDYEGWQRLRLFDNFMLTLHPDLQVTSIEHGENKAILLGYAIDPYQPELDDAGIIRRFVTGRVTVNKVTDRLENLSGRFVLIINCPQGSWLFHDACGLRQVNHFKDRHGNIWCASQSETLAEYFGLPYDEAMLDFRNAPEYRLTTEDFALINDRSPFKKIKYLLANHYLDLRSGKVTRFWPTPDCIGALPANKSIELIKPILQDSIKGAANRFNLKMGISAGCDSRKSLAAAKDVTDKIYFFTLPPQADSEIDLEIPSRLLPKLGIEHHKIDIEQMSQEFEELYRCSATWARARHGHIAYTALNYFGTGATVLNSNISEYSQVSYWLPQSHINGEGLAILKGLNHPLAIKDYQIWLDGSYPSCMEANLNVLVLFQLELRSRWVANTFAECDIAYESFNPYNNRRLYCIELSVNERLRRPLHRYDFPKKLIKNMWPEVLQEPINPEKNLSAKIKNFILHNIIFKTISPWLPLVEFIKYLRLKKDFKKQAIRDVIDS
jgi:hypothetical protein